MSAYQRLHRLLTAMRARSKELEQSRVGWTGFDAALLPAANGDVAHLALVTHGEGWEACCEDGTYDLWYRGALREPSLSRETAVERLLDEYWKAKVRYVQKRVSAQSN